MVHLVETGTGKHITDASRESWQTEWIHGHG